jgi:hypothetical protein
VADLAGQIAADFRDTAAAIECPDLVIAVDTSVAHLAGALGRPVWVLFPYYPDWRWLRAGDGSAWHPTARLFRQRRRGDWADVFARVAQALAKHARPSRTATVRIEVEPAELTDWLALLEAASGEPHQRRALASRLRLPLAD